MIVDQMQTSVVKILLLSILFLSGGCRGERARPATDAATRPATVELRYRFQLGRERRFESETVERGGREITITMRTRWTARSVRADGTGEIDVVVESYRYRVFPPSPIPADAVRLNDSLAGARFRLAVSPDGRHVEHLEHEDVPEVSSGSVGALQATLASHVLRLPIDPVRSGQRWTRETTPAADAGPEAIHGRSQWRVISIRPRGSHRMVELSCLSTMAPGLLTAGNQLIRTQTEFHYSYLWNATEGYLEELTSRGENVTTVREQGDAGAMASERVAFEARLRLLTSGAGRR